MVARSEKWGLTKAALKDGSSGEQQVAAKAVQTVFRMVALWVVLSAVV